MLYAIWAIVSAAVLGYAMRGGEYEWMIFSRGYEYGMRISWVDSFSFCMKPDFHHEIH